MLHSSIHWPRDGLVRDLAAGVAMFVSKLLQHSDVFVVFDCYFEKSLKSDTQPQRIGNFQQLHQVSIETSLLSKEVCMSSLKTIENLIEIIAKFLLQRFSYFQHFMAMFDEADYIIPQQVNTATEQSQAAIKVISADTDVFLLLGGMYMKENWIGVEIYMDNFNSDKTVISIHQAV